MTARGRGLALLAIQLGLAGAVVGKYAYDRATLPRAWARTVAVDPVDLFRGRYVQLWLDVPDRRTPADTGWSVQFGVEGDRVIVQAAEGWGGYRLRRPTPAGAAGVVVDQPLAYFIPEGIPDPSQVKPGEALWVEVSVPPHDLPRPIRIEIRSGAS